MDVDFRLHAVGRDPEADRAHLRGMAEAYAEVGYGPLVPRADELTGHPVYFITGWAGGVPVAGVRMHLRDGVRLPTERNFDDVVVDSVVRALQDTCGPVAEAAGTWVAPAYRGSRLSSALVALAYAAGTVLDVAVIIGSSPAEIMPLYETVGVRYVRDHPKPATPLPGVTGYFFYRRVTPPQPGLLPYEELSFAVAAEFRAAGRLARETLNRYVDAVPAPARRVAAGAGR